MARPGELAARLQRVALARALPSTLACLAVCVLIGTVATVDYAHIESRLPDAEKPDCVPTDADCFSANLRQQIGRQREAEPLQDQYGSRAWFYAFAILGTAAVAVAYSLRSRPRKDWSRIFTNVGVAGVWVGIAMSVLLVLTSEASIRIRAAPALTVPVVLLAGAAIGTLIGRSEGWAEESPGDGVRERAIRLGKLAVHLGTAGAARRSRVEKLGWWMSFAAIGLTVLTAILALAFVLPQPECPYAEASPPGWTNPIDSAAAVIGVVAIAAGITALVLRRWIAALISLVANPIALLAILASTCAFY
jgi:nitrate reductase gamma subunit